jgi:hypothetical protein
MNILLDLYDDDDDIDRMRNEMLDDLAPAVEGPENFVTKPISIVCGDNTVLNIEEQE